MWCREATRKPLVSSIRFLVEQQGWCAAFQNYLSQKCCFLLLYYYYWFVLFAENDVVTEAEMNHSSSSNQVTQPYNVSKLPQRLNISILWNLSLIQNFACYLVSFQQIKFTIISVILLACITCCLCTSSDRLWHAVLISVTQVHGMEGGSRMMIAWSMKATFIVIILTDVNPNHCCLV